MNSAFGRNRPLPPCRVGHQMLMHRLGCYPRIGQRRLEFRIGLARWLNQRVNLRHQFRLLLFGLVSATSREVVDTTNPSAKFVQPPVDRISSPAKDLFGSTGMTLAILERRLGLK